MKFDYPSSYDKTPKHVITFFIIFIPKTSKPNLTSGGATLLSAELGVRVDYPNPLNTQSVAPGLYGRTETSSELGLTQRLII